MEVRSFAHPTITPPLTKEVLWCYNSHVTSTFASQKRKRRLHDVYSLFFLCCHWEVPIFIYFILFFLNLCTAALNAQYIHYTANTAHPKYIDSYSECSLNMLALRLPYSAKKHPSYCRVLDRVVDLTP